MGHLYAVKKSTCYWDWEEMREIGESDTDIVRKMYGKLRTLEGREQQSDIFAGYLETYDLPVKTQAEMEQLEIRLLNYPSPDREEDRSIKNQLSVTGLCAVDSGIISRMVYPAFKSIPEP